MATKQLTSFDSYVLPRVNLLPPEIGERRAERRSYAVMGLAVLGALAAVVVLYLGQAAKVSAAKTELKATQDEGARLKADRAKRQSVEDVYKSVEREEALLTLALQRRVIWSSYLHNVSISIPENVWVTQFTAAIAAPATQAPEPGAAPAASGTMTFDGKAFEFNDVAAWLETVAKLKGVGNATFSTAAKVKPTVPGARTLVHFSSSASLTPVAISPHKKPVGSR